MLRGFSAIFPSHKRFCTLLRSSQVWAFHLLPFCVRGELLVQLYQSTLPVWMCAAHYIPALQVNEWNHTDLRAEAFHWSVCFMYWSSPVNLCIRSYLYWHGHGFLPSVQMCTPVCSYPPSCNVKSRYFRLVQVCVCKYKMSHCNSWSECRKQKGTFFFSVSSHTSKTYSFVLCW